MQIRTKLTTGILIAILCFCVAGAYSSGIGVPQFIERKIEPMSQLLKNQLIKFKLEFEVNPQFLHLAGNDGSVIIKLTPMRDEKEIIANYEWPIKYGKEYSHSLEFDLVIPDNNVFTLYYQIKCGSVIQEGSYFFNTVSESMEFAEALIDPPMPRDHLPKQTSIIPVEQLTDEHKKKVFKFIVDLSDPNVKKAVESFIGPISTECLVDPRRKSYFIETSLENAIKIGEMGTEIDFVNRPRWRFNKQKQEYDLIEDTISVFEIPKSQYSELSYNEKYLSPPGISIDSVSPLTASGNLPTDELITFYLHAQNNSFMTIGGMQNGLRIYSPNGASWSSTQTDTLPAGWKDMFDFVTMRTYSNDGQGADTVAFGFSILSSSASGMPWSFDSEAWTITIGPIDVSMDDKTICIDSSFFDQAGTWYWTDMLGSSNYYPAWSGDTCFTIEAPSTIKYSGYLYYTEPLPPTTTQPPIRRTRIEMRDVDIIGTQLLAWDTTDENGYFELGPVDNTTDIVGTQDVILRFYAENEHAYVTEEINGDIYQIVSPEVSNIPAGEFDTIIVMPVDTAGAFFIADMAILANEKMKSVTGVQLPQVQVTSDHLNIGTKYFGSDTCIFMEGVRNDSKHDPDSYDKDVFFHEYGHYIEHMYDFFHRSSGGM